MNYYFFLDLNNIIDQVVCNDDAEDLTSQYSQLRNQRCIKRSNADNLPGIGYTYMDDLEAFVKPQPFPSWTLSTETAEWQAPEVKPDDGNSYIWDENSVSWQLQPTFNLSNADADLIASVSSLEEFEAIKDQLSEEGFAQLGLN